MKDLYTYEPNSLISGAELEAGFTFDNSIRCWANPEDQKAAVRGELTVQEILTKGPRKLKAFAR